VSPGPDQIAAAQQALTDLGVTLADLRTQDTSPTPTFGEYLPTVIAAAGSGASRTYWARMATAWADRRLNEVYASDIEAMKNTAATTARSRRTTRHGRHAGEHVVAAARAIYNRAIADGLIEQKDSPAHRVVKPRRLPNTRRALTAWELEQINATARVSGNDAVLDAILLRLHTETACRRGGALGVHLEDLDPDRCLIKLREKGSTVRWQPITPAMANCLLDHAAARGTVLPTDPLLRYRDGHPLTSRRYDHLWKRLGERLPWVAAQGISTHWLRHTTLTWVERHHGYGIARAYAGHTDNTGPATTTYIKASLQESRHRPHRHDRPTPPPGTTMNTKPSSPRPSIASRQGRREVADSGASLVPWRHEKPPGNREIALEQVF
jgi:site-specific recombinase XerD